MHFINIFVDVYWQIVAFHYRMCCVASSHYRFPVTDPHCFVPSNCEKHAATAAATTAVAIQEHSFYFVSRNARWHSVTMSQLHLKMIIIAVRSFVWDELSNCVVCARREVVRWTHDKQKRNVNEKGDRQRRWKLKLLVGSAATAWSSSGSNFVGQFIWQVEAHNVQCNCKHDGLTLVIVIWTLSDYTNFVDSN